MEGSSACVSSLFEELRAVARRDLDPSRLAVAYHLEHQAFARLVPPEREIELLAATDLLCVERHDDVALPQAATVTRSLRHDARDDDALVDRVGEDAEPGAPRATRDP